MTTITIERALLEQVKDAFAKVIEWDARRDYLVPYKVRDPVHAAQKKIDAALAAPATAPAKPERKPMTDEQTLAKWNDHYLEHGLNEFDYYLLGKDDAEAFHGITGGKT